MHVAVLDSFSCFIMLLISCCVCAYEWPLGVLYIVLQYSGGHCEPVPYSIAGPGGEACWFLCVQLYTCGIVSECLRVVLVVPVVYMVHVSCVVVTAMGCGPPWWPLITLGAPGLLLPLPLNSGGTRCCMHLWQTVGHLATNGFFITSRGCQLGELVARRCRYVCGAATVSVVGRQLCPCHLCMCGGWRGRVVEQLARALPPPAFLCPCFSDDHRIYRGRPCHKC